MNQYLSKYDPLVLIGFTAGFLVFLWFLITLHDNASEFFANFPANILKGLQHAALMIPCAKSYVEKLDNKIKEGFKEQFLKLRKNQVHKLPEKGMKEETILNRI